MNPNFGKPDSFQTLPGAAFVVALWILLNPSSLLAIQAEDYCPNLILCSHRWTDSDGKPLPFQTDQEIMEFLRTAEVVKVEKIPEGVTKPQKLYLEKDGIRAKAVFRYKEIKKKRWNDPNAGPRVDFRDLCTYECAAYRLSRLLGMNNIPPTVRRKVKGKNGTVQIWVEGAMTDTHRLTEKILIPDPLRWKRQDQLMLIWDELIYNDDRNKGNVLIDQDWNVWLIDHTRAFRVYSEIREANTEKIKHCEKLLWEKLKALDKEAVKAELDEYLRSTEIDGIMKRCNLLVEHIQGLIDQRGEEVVLFEFRPSKNQMAGSSE